MSVDSTQTPSSQSDSELLQELNDQVSSMVQQCKQDHEKTWQMLESVLEQIAKLQNRSDDFSGTHAIETEQPQDNVDLAEDEQPGPNWIVESGNDGSDPCEMVETETNAPTLQNAGHVSDPLLDQDQVEPGLASQQHQAEGKLTQEVISELASLFAETNYDEPEVDDTDEVDLWEHVKRKLFSDFHFTAFSDNQQELLVPADANRATESAAAKLVKSAKSKELNDALGITVELSGEIDSMRHELEEKLRQAEIELSIQRARISNQQAKLEERQLWLEQREREMQQAASGHGENNRWSRHIPAPRKKNES